MKLLRYFLTRVPVFLVVPLGALVTGADVLSPQEVSYKSLRQGYMCNTLSTTQVPTVAVCISGGGLRAAIGGLGFLKAFQESGFLDATTYLCGLSGSTWAISGWLQSQLSLTDYLTALKAPLNTGLLGDVSAEQILLELRKRYSSSQTISLDDIWGSLIAQKFIINPGQNLTAITLSNYATLPNNGSLPLPIYNCAAPLPQDATGFQKYAWVDWSPFQVRCPVLQSSIPLENIGSFFAAGDITQGVPVESLSWGQGVWGSAISADVQNVLNNFDSGLSGYEAELASILEKLIDTSYFVDELTDIRVFDRPMSRTGTIKEMMRRLQIMNTSCLLMRQCSAIFP